jgi:BASS family bile acid:Na+ symporter
MASSFLTSVGLPLALALIMLGLGLHLQPVDFMRVAQRPRMVLVALFCQMAVLPLLAWGLSIAMGLAGPVAVGVMLLAASPGGTTANLFSYLFKGDLALNITLTAINSLLVVVTIPFVVSLSLQQFMGAQPHVPLQWGKTLEVMVIVLAPVALGMLLRARWPRLAQRLERLVRAFSVLVLLLLIALILLREREHLPAYIEQVGLVCLFLNGGSLLLGYLAGRLAGAPEASCRAMAFEIGVHNTTLAIYLALSVLGDGAMSVAAAVYSLLMYLLAPLAGWLMQRHVPL